MKALLLLLLALTVVALIAGYIRNRMLERKVKRGEIDQLPEPVMASDAECCGRHDACEKLRVIMAHKRNEVVYFDDEELDAYRGRSAGEYTAEETTEFREVLTTMSEHEVEGWLMSLRFRGIEVPKGLRADVAHAMRHHHHD